MSKPTEFSRWMRKNLLDAFSGLITQDIDFIITNDNEQYFFVEEKFKSSARTGPAQAIIYKMLSEILRIDEKFKGCFKMSDIDKGYCNFNQKKDEQIMEIIRAC